MTNLDSILKSRDIALPTKVHLVKAMVFPVVKYGCESWTIKKAEHQITDTFELWCWRRLLRVPWIARRSNQSILKEMKLQHFGYLMWRTDSLKKTLMLGKIEGRRRGRQRMRGCVASPTRWTWIWASSGSWWWTGRPGVLQFMGSPRVRHDWVTELSEQGLFCPSMDSPQVHICECVCVLVTQLCPTLCDPIDCSLPGFSVHWLLQARILEWVAISFSMGSSQPRD